MTKKQKLEKLNDLYDLLSAPYRWTKGQMRKKHKRAEGGYAYCLIGGAHYVCREPVGTFNTSTSGTDKLRCSTELRGELIKSICEIEPDFVKSDSATYREMPVWIVTNYNDKRHKKDVLRVIKHTIERLS